jgi:hypothetical protein
MRVSFAAISSDRVSSSAVLVAGLLCGVSVFFVALPLAQSSPFPTPRAGGWVTEDVAPAAARSYQVASASSYQLASVSSRPVAEPVSVPDHVGAQAAVEWEAMTRSSGVLDLPLVQAAREDVEVTGSLPQAVAPAEAKVASVTSVAPAEPAVPRALSPQDEVDEYLWEVYQRSPVKKDGSGEFTWKDPAAAKRVKMSLKDYVIGGMDRDFREQLYHAGKAMDEAGLQWTMLSAFRDDYRQSIASGIKAATGNSLHGGSRATGGYGHGRAADIVNAAGDHNAVWRWLDRNGGKYGLTRPMPGYDPAHIQPGGSWHNVAMALRAKRTHTTEVADAQPVNSRGRRTKVARRVDNDD